MATTTIPRLPLAATASERLRSLVRGHSEDPPWARPLLIALLAGTLLAYLIDLTASGYANSFYAAAVQAGTRSWKAFFFGSIDPSSFITVDKPPASLWVMELFGRVFGFSSASMLVPQVLEGVLSVALLSAAVKRWFGAGAGLIAGFALAVTPVAALMFRFNNPDALMVCLMVAAAYCLVRALEGERSRRWMLGVGALLGFAFLAKMMEAFLVVPGFALVYLLAAPHGVRRRVTDLLLGGVALLAGCGWWVATVALWPASARPMIDGSPDNSILNLIFGYNGFSRLSGGSGAGGLGGGGASFSGAPGVLRLFNDVMAGQASWLLPAAAVVLVGGLAWRMRAPRTDRLRAALLLWGSWLMVSAAVFSFSSGVIHTYYTVELAPAIAAIVGIGAAVLWQYRDARRARLGMALMIAVTAAWTVIMLLRTPGWHAWLTPLVLAAAVAAIGGLLAPGAIAGPRAAPAKRGGPAAANRRRRLSAAVGASALTACLAAPLAYTAQTLSTVHTGSVPSAGPVVADTLGGFGGPGGRGLDGFAGARGSRGLGGLGGIGGADARGFAGLGGGATRGAAVSHALVSALEFDASRYRWVAATSGSQSAASLELASGGEPVMAIGGFNGNGGNLSLAQFEKYVRAGEVHYYIAGSARGFGAAGPAALGAGGGGFGPAGRGGTGAAGGQLGAGGPSGLGGAPAGGLGAGEARAPGAGGPGALAGGSAPSGFPGGRAGGPGRGQSTQAISAWVTAHYRAVTIGGETVYDLTKPKS